MSVFDDKILTLNSWHTVAASTFYVHGNLVGGGSENVAVEKPVAVEAIGYQNDGQTVVAKKGR